MTKKKPQPKKTPKPKPLKWEVVDTHDIKYGYFTLEEFLEQIRQNVPDGTKDEDILLEVDVDDTRGYYDDVIISVEMKVSTKK